MIKHLHNKFKPKIKKINKGCLFLNKIDKFKNENEKIINNIVNKMNVGLKDSNQKISENEQMNNEQIRQKNIVIQNLKTQNQNLQKEINNLKKENQKYTKNILDKAKKIIKNEAANSLQTNNNTNTQSNYQTLQEDDNLKSLFSNYNEKIKINPSSIRLIALRNLIDIIYDIYKYKTAYENKGLPK
jgi:translation elongation factor EF-G